MVNYLLGTKRQLEVGAGILSLTTGLSLNLGQVITGIAFIASVMDRHNINSGWVFRIGYTSTFD